MSQTLTNLGRVFARSIYTKQHNNTFLKKTKALVCIKRKIYHKTEKNVVISSYADVVIPSCSVSDYIWQNLDSWHDKIALVCGLTGRSYTYAVTYKISEKFAASLKTILKLENGDCFAVMLPNNPEFPISVLGAIKAGCVVTTVNPLYTAHEVSHQLLNSKAKAIITINECYPQIKKSMEMSKYKIPIIIVKNGDDLPEGTINFQELIDNPSIDVGCLKDVNRTANDTVFIPYSSGTTGIPKGVELLNRNLVANFQQVLPEKITIYRPAIGSHQDVSICVLPFFHIYGLSCTLLSKLALGVKIVTLPKFTPETYLNVLAKYKANVLYLVPPIVIFLSSHPSVSQEHLGSIQRIMSGAAPLTATDVDRFLEKTKTNVEFMQGYGMTESSPALLLQERGATNYASVGCPIPNTEAKVVDLEKSDIVLGENQIGELWVRGPQIMKGYFENPAANEEIFRPNGWMRTGDLVYYDKNHSFYITDRLKELIKVKAFQVAPAELEGILRSHPDVLEAVVVGVPHPQDGETPRAFVVKKPDTSPSAKDIMNFVAEKVASYKKLGDLTFVDAIPKNAAGKILRKDVKAKFL